MVELADLQTCTFCWVTKVEAKLADLPASGWCCMAKPAAQLVAKLAWQQVHGAGGVSPGKHLENAVYR